MSDTNYFLAPAILPDHGIKTMADKGIRISFDTQELTAEVMTQVFMLKGRMGYLIFSATPLNPELLDIPDISPDFKGEKSPSQRLRAVLYKLWEQQGASIDFAVFYRSKMDSIINQVKEKLT